MKVKMNETKKTTISRIKEDYNTKPQYKKLYDIIRNGDVDGIVNPKYILIDCGLTQSEAAIVMRVALRYKGIIPADKPEEKLGEYINQFIKYLASNDKSDFIPECKGYFATMIKFISEDDNFKELSSDEKNKIVAMALIRCALKNILDAPETTLNPEITSNDTDVESDEKLDMPYVESINPSEIIDENGKTIVNYENRNDESEEVIVDAEPVTEPENEKTEQIITPPVVQRSDTIVPVYADKYEEFIKTHSNVGEYTVTFGECELYRGEEELKKIAVDRLKFMVYLNKYKDTFKTITKIVKGENGLRNVVKVAYVL